MRDKQDERLPCRKKNGLGGASGRGTAILAENDDLVTRVRRRNFTNPIGAECINQQKNVPGEAKHGQGEETTQ